MDRQLLVYKHISFYPSNMVETMRHKVGDVIVNMPIDHIWGTKEDPDKHGTRFHIITVLGIPDRSDQAMQGFEKVLCDSHGRGQIRHAKTLNLHMLPARNQWDLHTTGRTTITYALMSLITSERSLEPNVRAVKYAAN